MSEKKNVPRLRFPGFTEPWEQRKFGDIGSIAMCKRIFKEQTSDEGEVPFYKIGTFGVEPDAFISKELFDEYKTKYPYPNKGDILISASGSIGRTVEFTGKDEYFQDSNIVWLKHGNEIDNSFLKVLYSIVEWSCEGSTIKRLYNDNFLKTEFMLPQIDEQIKLGTYFSNLDNLITLHQRKLEHVRSLKKSMLQKMFPKNGQLYPEIRFPGFTDAWEQRKLGEVSDVRDGTHDSPKYQSIGHPFVTSKNVKNGYITYDDIQYISDEDFAEINKRSKVDINDILMGMIGTIGNMALIRTEPDFAIKNVALIKDTKQINYLYLYHLLQSPFIEKQLTSGMDGGTQKFVSLGNVRNLNVIYPSDIEQDKIGCYFEKLDHLITLHQRELDHLKLLKKGMLHQMFV